jgi:hypothetical protein
VCTRCTLQGKNAPQQATAHHKQTPAVPDALPVYRFYNFKNGTHFYTASEDEREYVGTQLGATYRYECVAYYIAP